MRSFSNPLLRSRADLSAAGLCITVVALVLGWWGWNAGGYFGRTFYPGEIILCAVFLALLIGATARVRLNVPAGVAVSALAALGLLTAASILWSDAPSGGIGDADQIVAYLILIVLGAWTVNLLGPRMHLALLPVVVAGFGIAALTTITISTGDDIRSYLHPDATLRFPIGYRNANAAFFLIATLPAIALAARTQTRWDARAALLSGASVCAALAILSQSRGSVPAAIVGAVVLIVSSRDRLRVAAYIVLALVPALVATPSLLEVFDHGRPDAAAIPILHTAGGTVALIWIASLIISAIATGVIQPRIKLGARAIQRIGLATCVLTIAAAVVAIGVVVERDGGPKAFVDHRYDEFRSEGTPGFADSETRFGLNAGSNRYDLWRVAINQGVDHPLQGGGSGSFANAYLQHRDSGETPRDPHSMEALLFAELGIPGLILLLVFVGGAGAAILRSRRLGPAAALLASGCGAGGAYWLVQASLDWFWNYPGATAPVMFLIGVGAGPALISLEVVQRTRIRAAAFVAALVCLILAVPPYLSGRYLDRATDEARSNPERALSDLDSSARWNPLDTEPLLSRAVLATRLGRSDLARQSLIDARRLEPDSYVSYYLMAKLLATSDPAAAKRQLERAKELDPGDSSSMKLPQAAPKP